MSQVIIPAHMGVVGEYKFRRFTADGTVRQETEWMRNLVVDNGLDWLAVYPGAGSSVAGCHVGSGNTPPALGDTSLESFVAGTTDCPTVSVSEWASSTPWYIRGTVTYRFGLGVAAGNLSEVGVSAGNTIVNNPNYAGASTAPLFSRALIVDSGGLPTTITVLPDEFLDVSFRLSWIPPSVDLTGTFNQTIEGVVTPFDYTLRPMRVNQPGNPVWRPLSNNAGNSPTFSRIEAATGFSQNVNVGASALADGGIGPATGVVQITAGGGHSLYTFDSVSSAAYTPGNCYRDLTYLCSLNRGNLPNPVNAMQFYFGLGGFQMEITPTFSKTSSKLYEVTFRVSWGNAP